MGRQVILTEYKHLFNQGCRDLQDLPGKDKKMWLVKVTAARK